MAVVVGVVIVVVVIVFVFVFVKEFISGVLKLTVIVAEMARESKGGFRKFSFHDFIV